MIIPNFNHFEGLHCETTATGSLLKQLDIHLSEAMLFGLGEGLGFIFWKMKIMEFPFIGGRVKPDELTENICKHLGLNLTVKETTSTKNAWLRVKEHLDNNTAVGLKLDCYHLDYFTNKIHFAGHYVAMYGYDEEYAYLVDTSPQGSLQKATLKNLELARSEKGPMSSNNLYYTINKNGKLNNLKEAVKEAILANCHTFLNPPIKNIGYKGIMKASAEIPKWFKESKNIKHEFQTTAMLMERAGTGGAIFRNIYSDFLKEAYDLLQLEGILECHKAYVEIAKMWTEVSELLHLAGDTENIVDIKKACKLLEIISNKEKQAMQLLETTIKNS